MNAASATIVSFRRASPVLLCLALFLPVSGRPCPGQTEQGRAGEQGRAVLRATQKNISPELGLDQDGNFCYQPGNMFACVARLVIISAILVTAKSGSLQLVVLLSEL